MDWKMEKKKKTQKKIFTILSLLNWTKKHPIIYIQSPFCSSWLLWYIRKSFVPWQKAKKACVLVSLFWGKLALYSPAVAAESQLRKHLLSFAKQNKTTIWKWGNGGLVGWLFFKVFRNDQCVKNFTAQYPVLCLRVYLSENTFFADLLHSSPIVSEHCGERSRDVVSCFCIRIKLSIALRKGKIVSWLFPSALPLVGKQGPSRAIKQRNLAVWFK